MSTLTVYPDPNVESTSVDGHVSRQSNNSTWAQIRDGDGTNKDDSDNDLQVGFSGGSADNTFLALYRSIILFDTSALGATATISAATLSLYGANKVNTMGLSPAPDINIYTSTPASNTSLAITDYAQTGTTAQCDTPISYASWSTSGYNDFVLNATGLGNISKTSITKFAARNANSDVANSEPSRTVQGIQNALLTPDSADQGTTAQDPKLVITYTVPTTAIKTINGLAYASVKTVNGLAIASVKTVNGLA